MIAETSFGESVAGGVRDVVLAVGDWIGSISTPGWVLIGVSAIFLLWVFMALRAQHALGPIEIAEIEYDDLGGATKPALKALTAEFRDRLALHGLTPPSLVPQGTPQVDLITAIGEIAGAQGNAIAAALKLLPVPRAPGYKVTTTLIDIPANRVRFMLQSTDGAPPCLDVVDGASYREALRRTASQVYREVMHATPDAFPPWTRWNADGPLNRYTDAREQAKRGELLSAIVQLCQAIREEPDNALAVLELANVYEQFAAKLRDGPGNDPERDRLIAWTNALALRRYLQAAVMCDTLVQARYRASIVAAALATDYGHLSDDAVRDELCERIAPLRDVVLPDVKRTPERDAYQDRLRELAGRESAATLQLLRRSYMLLRHRRLRNRFESTGVVRRELNHTVRISRQCVRLRELNAAGLDDGTRRRIAGVRSALVHGWHLWAGRANITWEARYNAVCFDALQLAGTYVTDAKKRSEIERRALDNLALAIRESSGALRRSWVAHDPDLEVFR